MGVALLAASAAFAITHGTAAAEPAGQSVQYTLSTAGPYEFQVTYLVNQPASMQAFNADSNAYLKRETITVAPGAPWVFNTTLADPQWAFLQVSSTARGGMAPPNAHCEVAVDGQVAVAQDHPYSPMCLLSQW